jgi:hypothetical protein
LSKPFERIEDVGLRAGLARDCLGEPGGDQGLEEDRRRLRLANVLDDLFQLARSRLGFG